MNVWWSAATLALLGGAAAVAVSGLVRPTWTRPERILRRGLRKPGA